MPLVEVDEIMPASVDKVWEVVNDVEAYPRLMEHVRSLEVRERGPNYRHTAWEVDLKGCVMNWVEREDIDAERYHIDYHQIEGDLAQFEGYWQLEPLTPDTCRAVLTVQFDIGIPMLNDMLNPIAERAIRESSMKMLMSLGSEAASEAGRKVSVQEVT